ncbi:MAG TPA: carbamate kinase [Afifellaceae bacterium]|nr:carbamate kinase [Afifellaceae bacterium]
MDAGHDLVVTHGNGPQVGLLALQGTAWKPGEAYPLDVLSAETEGMIGYLIEQELSNLLPPARSCATLLTQIEIDPNDPAFGRPDKPIGPLYGEDEAKALADSHGWSVAPDGSGWRRVVASPLPKRILEIGVIEMLVGQGVVVICAGGGGIPVIDRGAGGFIGVEAVIDKDRASALLAEQLGARALLLLTNVPAVYTGWETPDARPIRRAAPDALRTLAFAPGSMAPKVEAACAFAERTGRFAGIGRLQDASAILRQEAGTIVTGEASGIEWAGD